MNGSRELRTVIKPHHFPYIGLGRRKFIFPNSFGRSLGKSPIWSPTYPTTFIGPTFFIRPVPSVTSFLLTSLRSFLSSLSKNKSFGSSTPSNRRFPRVASRLSFIRLLRKTTRTPFFLTVLKNSFAPGTNPASFRFTQSDQESWVKVRYDYDKSYYE